MIETLYQQGSLKCLFPQTGRKTLDAVLLNTAGGVTGGDKMDASLRAGAGSQLTITTQACERVYKAQPGEIGTVRNKLHVCAGARLNWLPQETLLFESCALDRSLTADLAEDASLLLVEPVVFGRAAMGERVTHGTFSDRIEIRRSGQVIYLDAARLSGDLHAHMQKPAVANGAGAMAAVVFVDPSAHAQLEGVRALLPQSAGASLLADDILVLRILAQDSFEMRKALVPVLRLLNTSEIPRCWMI